MFALGGVVQLKSVAIEERPPAKENKFGSSPDLVAGNEGPG